MYVTLLLALKMNPLNGLIISLFSFAGCSTIHTSTEIYSYQSARLQYNECLAPENAKVCEDLCFTEMRKCHDECTTTQ